MPSDALHSTQPTTTATSGRGDRLILVVDDREDNRTALAEAFQRQGYAVLVASGGRPALEQIAAHAPDVVICDLKMPDVDGLEVLKTARQSPTPPEFILLTAFGTVETAVDALKQGAFNYLTKPVNLKDLRAQVEKAFEHRDMRQQVGRLRRQVEVKEEAPAGGAGTGYVFDSAAMRNLLAMVQRLGVTQSSVLLEGESGVGKEVIAHALHQAGQRGGGADTRPFIAVHCAALPESLLESELFGHEKGSFTGADRQMLGRLELADGGTLFLDEVGEIPLSMQVKLLRVLEQRELTRVGGRHVIRVNFRLIAATNRSLEQEVRAGRFREDLYYRLNVVRLVVPALRERREDIMPLFRSFLHRFAAEQGVPAPGVPPAIEAALLAHEWPGNVRELRNLAERVTIFAPGRELRLEDLPFGPVGSAAAGGTPLPVAAPLTAGALPPLAPGDGAGLARGPEGEWAGGAMATPVGGPASPDELDLQELERRTIVKALERFGGNRSAAAEALGISRRTLQRKLKEYRMAEAESDAEGDADGEGEG